MGMSSLWQAAWQASCAEQCRLQSCDKEGLHGNANGARHDAVADGAASRRSDASGRGLRRHEQEQIQLVPRPQTCPGPTAGGQGNGTRADPSLS